MKYFAILKDSFREVIDSKVIYVMMGLSLLVTLFVLTCSFKPVSAKETMTRALSGGLVAPEDLPGGGKRRQARRAEGGAAEKVQFNQFIVRNVETVKGAEDAPESAYRFTVSEAFMTKEESDQVRADPQLQIRRLKTTLQMAEQFGYFQVGEIRLASADKRFAGDDKELETKTVYFEVNTDPLEGARLMWASEFSLFLGALPLGSGLPLGPTLLGSTVLVLFVGSWVTLLVGVVLTAFFIPNMMRKGSVDLLLVKPIHRWALLLYKYIGGLTFVFLNTAVAICGIWLALGLRSGIWANHFLLMLFVYTFFFAILYAISTLFAVLTRNAIVAIFVTCGIWLCLFIVGVLFSYSEGIRIEEERDSVALENRSSTDVGWVIVRGAHYVLPRTSDLDNLGNETLLYDFLPPRFIELAAQGPRRSISWGESLSVSGLFIVVMLGLSCWRFATRDF